MMFDTLTNKIYLAVIASLITSLCMLYISNMQLSVDNENLKSVVIGMDAIHQKEEKDNLDRLKRFGIKANSVNKVLIYKQKILKDTKDGQADTCENSYRLLTNSGI